MKGESTGGSSAMHHAVDRVERFVEDGQVWVAVVAVAVLLLLQIPGIENVLTKIGLENSTQLRTAVGAIVLASILLELRQLNRRLTPVITGSQHYSDPNEMYNALIERAEEIREPEQRQIEVLGLTLFSAWPKLEFFLERPEVGEWTVKLATLSKDTAAARRWVPDSWPQESATTVTQIREFEARHGVDHNHTVELFEYDFTPVVHGFRLGNGDVFLSTLRWRDGRLGKHRFPYDYVSAHDISSQAAAVRALFRNWFDRAVRSASETSRGDAANLAPTVTEKSDG